MSPEQLAARYRQAVRSNAGQLRDSGGNPSEQMITQLVSIAEEHAAALRGAESAPGDSPMPGDAEVPEQAAEARRRASARKR